MGPRARRFTISGKVQGVFFRANTRRMAESLGLTGHAINLANGDVEVLACGPDSALDELEAWLNRGPRGSLVARVEAHDEPWQAIETFRTG